MFIPSICIVMAFITLGLIGSVLAIIFTVKGFGYQITGRPGVARALAVVGLLSLLAANAFSFAAGYLHGVLPP